MTHAPGQEKSLSYAESDATRWSFVVPSLDRCWVARFQ